MPKSSSGRSTGPGRLPQESDAGLGRPNRDPRYEFATDEEIANRRNTGRQSPLQNHAITHVQVGTKSGGQSLNDVQPMVRSGNGKFTEIPTQPQ